MKLLIVEGCDRVGKSTLIKNLTSQANNFVVRHFGSPLGDNDKQKRNFQFQFFKQEFELASMRSRFSTYDSEKAKDIWILDRGHLGEFVYGNMYRNTDPQQWVMKLEEMYGFDIDPSVYLLLLTADPEFLCKRDDGLSFTAEVDKKAKEIESFKQAFNLSKIMNKLVINVSNGENYLDADIILDKVNKFLFS